MSHVSRISQIRFDTYWTSSFTHFGFTPVWSEIHKKYKAEQATIETEMYDNHVYEKPPPTRTRIINQEHFDRLFMSKEDE